MMMKGWQNLVFGDLAYRASDVAEPGSFGAETPYIALDNIDQQNLRLNSIGRADQAVSGKTRFEPGDVLFGKLRPYFRKVVHPRFSGVCSTDIWVLRPREGVDRTFLFYSAASPRFVDHATKGSTGTKMPRADWKQVSQLTVQLPPLREQREISSILGALDDKIEINRQMNATREAIARALFQSWFVDFDPVRAKAEGRQPVGMDAETAALFPDSFENSALGPIPQGWKIGKNDDLTILQRQSVDPGSKPTQLFTHYSLPAFDDGLRAEKVVGDRIKSNKYVVPDGEVLVSKLNPHIPRIWLVDGGDELNSVCSTEFIVCTPSVVTTAEYLYLLYSSQSFTTKYRSLVAGTTGSHQRVRPEDFKAIEIVTPHPRLVADFTLIVGALLSQSANLTRTNEMLSATRNSLLPKLLSGELRVGDVAA